MYIKIINGVSPGTLRIIYGKVMNPKIRELIEQNKVTTVGLCHGEFTDMVAASDIAEKSSNVSVAEI